VVCTVRRVRCALRDETSAFFPGQRETWRESWPRRADSRRRSLGSLRSGLSVLTTGGFFFFGFRGRTSLKTNPRARRSRVSRARPPAWAAFAKMNRLNKAQKEKVKRFAAVSDADEKTALAVLKEVRWDLELGLETYFTSPSSHFASANVDAAALEKTYGEYRAADGTHDDDIIDAVGIERLCADIGIDPVDPVILNVSSKMEAKTMGAYTKEEFFRGMTRMETSDARALKSKIPALRAEMDDPAVFKRVFEYAFDFAKEPNHKSLPLETATAMFKVLLDGRWALVDEWCAFLEKDGSVKAVTRDTWNQTLEFSRQIGEDMSGYDPAGAWPYLIDEFVEHKLEQKS